MQLYKFKYVSVNKVVCVYIYIYIYIYIHHIYIHTDIHTVLTLNPAHTVRFWPQFGRLRQILKILKDSYNPRRKSVVFDCWFDMFNNS